MLKRPAISRACQPDGSSRAPLVVSLGLICFWLIFLGKVDDFDFWTHLHYGRNYLEAWSIDDFFWRGWFEGPSAASFFQLFVYALFKAGGYELVSYAMAGIFAATCAIFLSFGQNRPRLVALLWLLLVLLTAKVAANRLLPRPEIAGYLLFALALLVINAWLARPRPGYLALVGVILLLWYPMHQTVYLGVPFLLGVFLLLGRADFWPGLRHKRSISVLLTGLIVVAGVAFSARFVWFVVNGLRTGGILAGISEMRPTWEYPEILAEYLLLVVVVVGCCWMAGKIRWRLFTLLLPVVLLGLVVERNVAFAAFALLFLCQVSLRDSEWLTGAQRWGKPFVGGLLLLNIGAAGWLLAGRATTWGPGLEPGIVPVDAARFVSEQQLPGPVFNNLDCGGYLLWAWQGEPEHFLDGRLGAPERLQEHARVLEAKLPRLVFDKYEIRTILLQPAYWNSARLFPLLTMLMVSSEWSLVHASDALVFVRDVPAGLAVLSRQGGWQAVLRQLDLYAKVRPLPAHLEFSRSLVLQKLGRSAEARAAFERGQARHPELAGRYSMVAGGVQEPAN